MTITIPVALVTFCQAALIGAAICYLLSLLLGLIAVRDYGPTPKGIPLGIFLLICGTISALITGLATLVAMLIFSTALGDIVFVPIVTAVLSASSTSAYFWTKV